MHIGKMLKCANNDDSINISIDDGTDIVRFTFESPQHDKISEFEIKHMEIQAENLGIPETEYNVTLEMSSHEFSRIIKDLSSFGDTVEINVSRDGLMFLTESDEGSAHVICRYRRDWDGEKSDGKDNAMVDVIMQEEVTLTFALKYLKTFTMATVVADKVKLKMSRDLPIVIEYSMEGMGYIRFYLAPKIDEEELEDE